jgi:hypothetical protein
MIMDHTRHYIATARAQLGDTHFNLVVSRKYDVVTSKKTGLNEVIHYSSFLT